MEPIPASATATQTATLAGAHVHEMWEGQFEEPRNEAFYDMVFARLIALTRAGSESRFLEVGVGGGRHAIRIARHGIPIDAVDFSQAALDIAQENIRRAGVGDLVRLDRQDILALPQDDGAYTHVLCWGVLMHIPEIERAIAQLARLVAPGGYLILHEGNVASPEASLILAAKRLFRRSGLRRVPAGVEHWKKTDAGTLLTRRADVQWLTRQVETAGLRLRHRLPSQLTELYGKKPLRRVRGLLYAANDWWYKHGSSKLAVGNTLIFERPAGVSGAPAA